MFSTDTDFLLNLEIEVHFLYLKWSLKNKKIGKVILSSEKGSR